MNTAAYLVERPINSQLIFSKLKMSSFVFEGTLINVTKFRRLIESIKELVKEVNMVITDSGLAIQAIDSSHVALVSANIKSEGFSAFNCKKNITLGVSLENLIKVIKLAGDSDSITMQAGEDGDKLYLSFENSSNLFRKYLEGTKKIDFVFNLIVIESESFDIPEEDSDATLTMDASESARLFHDIYQVSETVTIEANEERFVFWSEGDMGKSRTVLTSNMTTKIKVKNTLRQSYAMRYLNMFNKAATCSTEMKMTLKEGAPMVLNYDLGTMGEIKFYLAPKKTSEVEMNLKSE
eukprot:TRINITY_DN12717_c0_g1_i3.p1 TRINITY_DN12717_c0_g1~~TRINITY_DN12717_c0_g1_i3.p1  ORF type:complete len:294 (-),score=68.58 TRINITY_DN12717_c0_g1_i3:171-1052(-)